MQFGNAKSIRIEVYPSTHSVWFPPCLSLEFQGVCGQVWGSRFIRSLLESQTPKTQIRWVNATRAFEPCNKTLTNPAAPFCSSQIWQPLKCCAKCKSVVLRGEHLPDAWLLHNFPLGLNLLTGRRGSETAWHVAERGWGPHLEMGSRQIAWHDFYLFHSCPWCGEVGDALGPHLPTLNPLSIQA